MTRAIPIASLVGAAFAVVAVLSSLDGDVPQKVTPEQRAELVAVAIALEGLETKEQAVETAAAKAGVTDREAAAVVDKTQGSRGRDPASIRTHYVGALVADADATRAADAWARGICSPLEGLAVFDVCVSRELPSFVERFCVGGKDAGAGLRASLTDGQYKATVEPLRTSGAVVVDDATDERYLAAAAALGWRRCESEEP